MRHVDVGSNPTARILTDYKGVNLKYFIEYNDDYADNGGVGIEQFDDKNKALEFVETRMKQNSTRKLSDYTLIKGEVIPMKAVEVVLKIEA